MFDKTWDRRRVYGVLFPCPNCEHNNRIHSKTVESLKLWLQDKLPACKRCGQLLRRDDYFFSENSTMLKRAKKELEIGR